MDILLPQNRLTPVPSKTFLAGEYAVLTHGKALLLTTPPYFTLAAAPEAGIPLAQLSPQSPAGQFYHDYVARFAGHNLQFVDPHHGQGGFGASSAQFVLLARCLGMENPWEIWQAYRRYTQQDAMPPSGADVVAQCFSAPQIIFVDWQQQRTAVCSWPFAEWQIILLRTGVKLATHEHLAQIKMQDFSPLAQEVSAIYQALGDSQAEAFRSAMQRYADLLAGYDLVAPATRQLLQHLRQHPAVAVAKGCGALGADVVLVVIRREAMMEFIQGINAQDKVHDYFIF